MTNARGPDISYWNGDGINFAVLAAAVDFVFIRACWAEYEDLRFAQNWQGAAEAGILRGGYCYFRPERSPERQAEKLAELAGGGELPAVLDIEYNPEPTSLALNSKAEADRQSWQNDPAGFEMSWLQALWVRPQSSRVFLNQTGMQEAIGHCVNRYTEITGKSLICYTRGNWWDHNVGNVNFGMDLWVAHWFTDDPILPQAWSSWHFHQWSDRESFPGIPDQTVDANWFNGTREELLVYAGRQPDYSLEEKVDLLWGAHPELHSIQ